MSNAMSLDEDVHTPLIESLAGMDPELVNQDRCDFDNARDAMSLRAHLERISALVMCQLVRIAHERLEDVSTRFDVPAPA